MKPASFEYFAPETLEEALAIKAKHGDDVKPLAGGQSMIPAMNYRVAQPEILVDLNKINELSYIKSSNGELHIGAMTRQREVEKSDDVAIADPLLHETMPYIAHPQIRNRGTFGGSLAHADPAAELPVIAIARDAQFRVENSNGDRLINAKDFFMGYFEVSLQVDELLVEIIFPKFPANTGWSFMEIARRKGDFAMAGVAALITLNDGGICEFARLVYLNVGEGPTNAIRAAESLQGEKINKKSIANACQIAIQSEMEPYGNLHASADYQKHLCQVLTVRAMAEAHKRAKSRISER